VKSNDLVKLIQKLDPSGELDITVDNIDIYDISLKNADANGWYQKLIIDRGDKHVSAGKYIGVGKKLVLSTYSFAEALRDWPEMPIEFDGTSKKSVVTEFVNNWRSEGSAAKDGNNVSPKIIEPAVNAYYAAAANVFGNDDDDDEQEF
jgi:hypothetical protein